MERSERTKCWMPQRVITGIMGFLAITVGFTMRSCLSVTITEMVVPLNNTANKNDSYICQLESTSTTEQNQHSETTGIRFDWSQEKQGWILSSFFIGYVIAHIPGGLIAEKYGGKSTLTVAILSLGICTIATPLILEYGGYMTFIFLRILMGLASGTTFPALTVLLAAWVPESERSKLGSLAMGGGSMGNVLSFFLSGMILSKWSWPYVFYFWGFISLIWSILFAFICYNDPASNPHISEEERDYLKSEIGELKRRDDLPPTPWTSILTSVPIIAFIITQIGQDWVYFIISSDFPKYMKEVLAFSVKEIGVYSGLSYFVMWICSILSSFLCDHLICQGHVTVTQARKIFTTAAGVPVMFIVGASYAGCNKMLVVILLNLAMAFNGNFYPGLKVNSLDLSPNYAGSIMALTNGAGSLAGVAAPVFVGMMTPNSTHAEWKCVFWISFAITLVRVTIYLIWGSAEIQPWNDPKKHESPENDKLNDISNN